MKPSADIMHASYALPLSTTVKYDKIWMSCKATVTLGEKCWCCIASEEHSHSLVKITGETGQCFFCVKPTNNTESLLCTSTFGLDNWDGQSALSLQNQNIFAKLSPGDLLALEAPIQQCQSMEEISRGTIYSSINQSNSYSSWDGRIHADARVDNGPVFKMAHRAGIEEWKSCFRK